MWWRHQQCTDTTGVVDAVRCEPWICLWRPAAPAWKCGTGRGERVAEAVALDMIQRVLTAVASKGVVSGSW